MNISEKYLKSELVFRNSAAKELGAGFLRKHGVRNDFIHASNRHFAVVLVLQGSGIYQFEDGRSWKLKPGSVFCRIPQTIHSTILEPNSKWQECFLSFSQEAFSFLQQQNIWNLDLPVFESQIQPIWLEQLYTLIARIKNATSNQLPLYWLEAVQLVSTLESYSRQVKQVKREDLVKDACQQLNALLDQPLNMQSLAAKYGISYSLFRRLFKDVTGQSPGAYRIQQRMDQATQMLLASDASIKDIAYQLGYPDPYTFSEQFKNSTGLRPSPLPPTSKGGKMKTLSLQ